MGFDYCYHIHISTNKVSFRAVPLMKIQPIMTIAIGVLLASLVAVPSTIWAGPTDCNENGIPDGDELIGNDCNSNLVLDVCENDTFGTITAISYTTPGTGESYPHALQLDGDELLVSSISGRDSEGQTVGSVDYFRLINGEWTHAQTIFGPNIGTITRFGQTMVRAGDWLVVGAPWFNVPAVPGNRDGAVWLYRFSPDQGIWLEHSMLADVQGQFEFGTNILFDGKRLIVTGFTSNHIFRTQMLCYELIGDEWTVTQNLAQENITAMPTDFSDIDCGTITSTERTRSDTGQQFWRLVVREYSQSTWRVTYQALIAPVPIGQNSSGVASMGNTCDRAIAVAGQLLVIDRVGSSWQPVESVGNSSNVSIQGPYTSDRGRLFAQASVSGTPQIIELTGPPGAPELVPLAGLEGLSGIFDVSGNQIVIADSESDGALFYARRATDCDGNDTLDACQINDGAADVDRDGVLDNCQTDCNQDGIPDGDQLAELDCDANGILDVCDVDPTDPDGDGAIAEDCNNNALPDRCEPDCDGNGVVDSCDLDALDPDGDGMVADDCNQNGVPDACDRQRNIGQIARITPPMDAGDILFGCSIALDEDLLIVGATAATNPATEPGSVFIYRFDGANWQLDGVLTAPEMATTRRQFGYVVAATNGRVIVRQGPTPSEPANKIHVFTHDGTSWQLVQTILEAGDFLSFERPAMHALGIDLYAFAPSPGALSWYWWLNGQYVEVGRFGLDIVDPTTILRESLAVNDSEIFMLTSTPAFQGPPLGLVYDRFTPFAGPVNLFNESGTLFVPQLVSYPPALAATSRGIFMGCGVSLSGFPDRIGYLVETAGEIRREFDVYQSGSQAQTFSIEATDDRAFVAAPRSGMGRVDVYQRRGVTWDLISEIHGPNGQFADEFGSAMDVSDRFLAVASNAGLRGGFFTTSPQTTMSSLDSVFVYAIDGDLNQNGIFDGCEDCDGNGLPDDFERAAVSIDAFVSSLLSENPSCAYDLNADGTTNGRDLPDLIELLLSSP